MRFDEGFKVLYEKVQEGFVFIVEEWAAGAMKNGFAEEGRFCYKHSGSDYAIFFGLWFDF